MADDTMRTAPTRSRTRLAWGAIALCVVISAWTAFAGKQAQRLGGGMDVAGIRTVDSEGRQLVGQRELGLGDERGFAAALDALDGGRLTRRHRVVILSSELVGLDDARRRLIAADAYMRDNPGRTLLEVDGRVDGILHALYLAEQDELAEQDDDVSGDAGDVEEGTPTDAAWSALVRRADALSPGDRKLLAEHLGWIGRLATVPVGTSRDRERAAVLSTATTASGMLVGAVGLLCCAGTFGFVAAIALLVGFARGQQRSRWTAASLPSGVLLEIFAVWFVAMTVPHVARWGPPLLTGRASWGAIVLGPFALAVGRVRGVDWRTLRTSIGLHRGAGFLREASIGLLACPTALPIVAVGALGSAVLAQLAQRMDVATDATHPIVGGLGDAGRLHFVVLLIVAAVVAPILEETFFRGVLYRYLRGASAGLGRAGSVAISGFASAFIFASVHPQSWIAIPALGAIGLAFALLREWRDSLIAPIVAHGLWNGALVTITWLV